MQVLRKDLLPTLPWYTRWSGLLNDYYNTSAINDVLRSRDKFAVKEMWARDLPAGIDIDSVLACIGDEMGWNIPSFISQDECFIVLKLWWHGMVDAMERERTIISLEKIVGKKFKVDDWTKLNSMTLSGLIDHFQ